VIPIHSPMRTPQLSSARRLVEYICDEQEKHNRIANVRITNCSADDPQTAILHMQDVQFINQNRSDKRAKSEINYHLMVSFKHPENPPIEVLHAIEDRLCQALGYEQHQRVSAVHTDTDHLHIHIAINKINPFTHNIHDPKGDYKILAQECAKLEAEFGLRFDNHTPKRTVEQGQIKNVEAKTGIKSLLTYVEENCLEDLKAAQSWPDIHQILGKFGLEIKPRGNGLVIVALDKDGKPIKGASLKASQLGRQFSKSKLEAKFGVFEPSLTKIKAIKHYEFEPVNALKTPQENTLWNEYKHNQKLAKSCS